MSWRTDPDGMVTICARLPPETAAAITAVIDHHVMADRAPAGASPRQQRVANLRRLVGLHNRARERALAAVRRRAIAEVHR